MSSFTRAFRAVFGAPEVDYVRLGIWPATDDAELRAAMDERDVATEALVRLWRSTPLSPNRQRRSLVLCVGLGAALDRLLAADDLCEALAGDLSGAQEVSGGQ